MVLVTKIGHTISKRVGGGADGQTGKGPKREDVSSTRFCVQHVFSRMSFSRINRLS